MQIMRSNSSILFSKGEASAEIMGNLEKVQKREKEIIRGCENRTYKKNMEELGLFSLDKRRQSKGDDDNLQI